MNNKLLVKISNVIGIISIVLLVYWVFTFIMIKVFGLKVFRENMTETFYMSILGILAMMIGSLIVNIMFNLTRIAQKHNADNDEKKVSKLAKWILIGLFPIIAIFLFTGDYLTSKKKEKLLVDSAKSIVENNNLKSQQLLNYTFSKEYLQKASNTLNLLGETDKNFPNVTLIVRDTIEQSPVFLGFSYYSQFEIEKNDTTKLNKISYIHKTTNTEREYLNAVFEQKTDKIRYSSNDGNYELFYPFIQNNKVIVFYFSDYQRYGKIGS